MHIANYPSKKAFAAAVAISQECGARSIVRVIDPAIINPVTGDIAYVLRTLERRGDDSFTVTNHPKRSWYAVVSRGRDGKISVK